MRREPFQMPFAAAVSPPAVAVGLAARQPRFAAGFVRVRLLHPPRHPRPRPRRRLRLRQHRARHLLPRHPELSRLQSSVALPPAAAVVAWPDQNRFAGPPRNSRPPHHSSVAPATVPLPDKCIAVRQPRRPMSLPKKASRHFDCSLRNPPVVTNMPPRQATIERQGLLLSWLRLRMCWNPSRTQRAYWLVPFIFSRACAFCSRASVIRW